MAVPTAGIVLAAGAGRRYGHPKILVPGWLDAAIDALYGGGCNQVYVLTGAARPSQRPDVHEIHVPGWSNGIGATLRAGLEHLLSGDESVPPAEQVVLHVVDCPDIGSDVVSRVLEAGDGLRRAVFDGRPGHPVVIPYRNLRPLLDVLEDHDGAGPYLRAHRHQAIECGDLASGEDVDHRTGPFRPGGVARR